MSSPTPARPPRSLAAHFGARGASSSRRLALGVSGVLLVGAIALGVLVARERRALAPVDLHSVDYVGSAACMRCHGDHTASFRRTFHRTMTQQASRETLAAPFEGETLAYGGVVARMFHEPDGHGGERFVVEASRGTELVDRSVVDRTVGSHRHQQLLTRRGDRWLRLPVAWNVEEGRWFHMNEAFFTPDPVGLDEGRVATVDYARHVVPWNDNCVFCHNVDPRPGLDADTGVFATEVAELGVACEACHGPGAAHVEANTSPLRRYALHGGGLFAALGASPADDPTIVSPAELSPSRAAEVCGRCHGQRVTAHLERVLADGDGFVPGDELAHVSRPLFADTPLHGDATVFAPRFWSDGTPRLTAYEYQGLLQSACAREGGLTCIDCHAMHAGDPRGQLDPARTGDAMCTRCHTPDRTHADPDRTSTAHDDVACVDCHMPRVVTGVRSVLRSHRIDVPRSSRTPPSDGALLGERERPDACALCHLDDVRPLFAGDPIQRAVYARALGRLNSPAASPSRLERASLLLATLRDDTYPAVRGIAHTSLVALAPELAALPYTPTAPAGERRASVDALARALGVGIDSSHDALRALASTRAIEIGE